MVAWVVLQAVVLAQPLRRLTKKVCAPHCGPESLSLMEPCKAQGVTGSSEWLWNSTILGLSPVQTYAFSKKKVLCTFAGNGVQMTITWSHGKMISEIVQMVPDPGDLHPVPFTKIHKARCIIIHSSDMGHFRYLELLCHIPWA